MHKASILRELLQLGQESLEGLLSCSCLSCDEHWSKSKFSFVIHVGLLATLKSLPNNQDVYCVFLVRQLQYFNELTVKNSLPHQYTYHKIPLGNLVRGFEWAYNLVFKICFRFTSLQA